MGCIRNHYRLLRRVNCCGIAAQNARESFDFNKLAALSVDTAFGQTMIDLTRPGTNGGALRQE
jgi:hypothetical protein